MVSVTCTQLVRVFLYTLKYPWIIYNTGCDISVAWGFDTVLLTECQHVVNIDADFLPVTFGPQLAESTDAEPTHSFRGKSYFS